ncbi:MAG: ferritin-like domain-containing protein [Arenimonas sp.]|nr:ferritin-like domain-containing protein [Arenimonas sp.]
MELRQAARAALLSDIVQDKLDLMSSMAIALQHVNYTLDTALEFPVFNTPGRPLLPELVLPREVPRRGLNSQEGRAALLHAIAHIEFNAINLACDAMQRFSHMPETYYLDWASVAVDEARHFQLLQTRLAELGFQYGDFKAHNGLWEMAEKTEHSCLARMALVPRLLEARGLDVTPGMIEKLRQLKDDQSVAVLSVILSEEIRHVAIGTHWFNYCCNFEQKNPEHEFIALLQGMAKGSVRGPYNLPAREQAGFTDYEMQQISVLGQS